MKSEASFFDSHLSVLYNNSDNNTATITATKKKVAMKIDEMINARRGKKPPKSILILPYALAFNSTT